MNWGFERTLMRNKILLLLCLALVLVSCTKDEVHNRFMIIAHQGYWKAAAGASNSLKGLTKSVELGIEGGELDVRCTLDDSLVLCHDAQFGKYTVANTSYNQLCTIRLSDGSRIPTFREYVTEASKNSRVMLFVDVKDIASLRQIIDILEEYNAVEQTILLLSSANIESALNINDKLKIMIMDESINLEDVKERGAYGIAMNINQLKNKSHLIQEAHQLGLKVNTWVIKSESEIVWCSMHDVDYVTTDSPLECKQYLYQ